MRISAGLIRHRGLNSFSRLKGFSDDVWWYEHMWLFDHGSGSMSSLGSSASPPHSSDHSLIDAYILCVVRYPFEVPMRPMALSTVNRAQNPHWMNSETPRCSRSLRNYRSVGLRMPPKKNTYTHLIQGNRYTPPFSSYLSEWCQIFQPKQQIAIAWLKEQRWEFSGFL